MSGARSGGGGGAAMDSTREVDRGGVIGFGMDWLGGGARAVAEGETLYNVCSWGGTGAGTSDGKDE